MSLAELILIGVLIVASITDLKTRTIPNSLTFTGLLAVLLAAALDPAGDGWSSALWGAAVCGGLMLMGWIAFCLGGGDVKLAAVMGAGLGWMDGLNALLFSFTFAAIWLISRLIWTEGVTATLTRFRKPKQQGLVTPSPEAVASGPEVAPVAVVIAPDSVCFAPAALLASLLVLSQSRGWLAGP